MDNEREIYKLWREYLKRTDEYKKFKNRSNGEEPIGFFDLLGEVYTRSFNVWWELRRQQGGHGIVSDYADLIEKDFDNCIESFKASHEGREPSLQEVKEYFCKFLKQSAWFSYLRVSITEDKTAIKEELDKIIDSCREKPNVKNLTEIVRKYSLTPDRKHIRLDVLKTCLEVYDFKMQGLKSKDIIKKHDPNIDCKHESMQRRYRMHFERAKKIIKNVKHGLFPGKY